MFIHEVDDDIALKLLDENDGETLFQLTDNSRDYLREWLPWVDGTKTADDSKEFIRHILKMYTEQKGLTAGILFNGQLIGTAGFNTLDWSNNIGTIGYWMDQGFQGNGIMTRVVRALIDYAFQELKLNRIEIRAAFENRKSRAIPERLGFTQEGKVRQAEWLYDHYVDLVIYGMLACEWEQN
ncbi:GNAT family N-acetyltransferase [Virgibacillus oceani]|uniref:Ribosomal-protein-serine acetyltransferase n=1 Tax=Virgibacillus oceani TaxID=1479511 RepID=A0A917HF76_9BACI|nr:GNAT family protein [Virgibacillus oceani]GGG76582.1 ribosomal-protein-serine acetyltransferase [Virgibacillus oceani]